MINPIDRVFHHWISVKWYIQYNKKINENNLKKANHKSIILKRGRIQQAL